MTQQQRQYSHFLYALTPVLFTPVLAYLFAEGAFYTSDKDIVFIVPYLLWAATFFVVAAVLILKRWAFRAWLKRALLLSFCLVLVLALIAGIIISLNLPTMAAKT